MITTTIAITSLVIILTFIFWNKVKKNKVEFGFKNHNLIMTSKQKENWDRLTTSQKQQIIKEFVRTQKK